MWCLFEHLTDQIYYGEMSNINMICLIFVKELHKILFSLSPGSTQRCMVHRDLIKLEVTFDHSLKFEGSFVYSNLQPLVKQSSSHW